MDRGNIDTQQNPKMMFAHAATQPGIDQQLNLIKKQWNNTQSVDGEGTDPQYVREGEKDTTQNKIWNKHTKETHIMGHDETRDRSTI